MRVLPTRNHPQASVLGESDRREDELSTVTPRTSESVLRVEVSAFHHLMGILMVISDSGHVEHACT